MGRSRRRARGWTTKLAWWLFGALLTGFTLVLLNKLLGKVLEPSLAITVSVGLAVTVSLTLTQWLSKSKGLLKGVSPVVAGLLAAMGVHLSRTWLS